MSTLNAREYLVNSLRLQHARFVNDLNAISADQQHVSHSGCARSPLYMTAECGWVNGWIATFLESGISKRMSEDEEEAFYATFDTTAKALAYLQETTDRLAAVYEALDENTLGDVSDVPFRRPATRFSIATLPIQHLSYHDGQLNYIQSLHGDDKIHW